jgi:hypothetical protein
MIPPSSSSPWPALLARQSRWPEEDARRLTAQGPASFKPRPVLRGDDMKEMKLLDVSGGSSDACSRRQGEARAST